MYSLKFDLAPDLFFEASPPRSAQQNRLTGESDKLFCADVAPRIAIRIAPQITLRTRRAGLARIAILMLPIALFSAAVFAATAVGNDTNNRAKLATLADQYHEARLQFYSLASTEEVGDPRFEGELTIDIAPAHRALQAKTFKTILATLKTIHRPSLPNDDQLTADVLKYDVETKLESLNFPRHLLPIHQMESVPVKLAGWAGGQSVQPFKTVKNYENFLHRIAQLPAWNAQAIANMQAGMKNGVLQSKPIVERALEQLNALAASPLEESAFYSPITRMPTTFSEADRRRLTGAYKAELKNKLLPSLKLLHAFVRDQYLPATVKTAGLGALPNGAAWYKFAVRESTTTNLSADEIHALGLKEVARILSEMERVKKQVGADGKLSDFLSGLDRRPELLPFKTDEEVFAKFAALNEQIKPKLAKMFGLMPKAPLEIRPVDKLIRDTASSHYISPASDGSRPGVFYAVIHDPLKFSTPSMAALFLHEGQPGHHFQLALQQELDLPAFRRFIWYDAYGEGWALYAESLGRELGVYDDPYSYLGRLQSELVRAVRLVVDTGLHAKNWSREKTIQYIMDNQGSAEADARRATERYMVWAGQALSYKVGELKILELRARAEKALGDRFDLRAFHDAVLRGGGLPLSVLETQIDALIASIARGGKT